MHTVAAAYFQIYSNLQRDLSVLKTKTLLQHSKFRGPVDHVKNLQWDMLKHERLSNTYVETRYVMLSSGNTC